VNALHEERGDLDAEMQNRVYALLFDESTLVAEKRAKFDALLATLPLRDAQPFAKSRGRDGGEPTNTAMTAHTVWDSGKCIDASPLVVDDCDECHVYVGSHSARFCALRVDGKTRRATLEWEVELDDRVEATAVLSPCGTLVVVGESTLICINVTFRMYDCAGTYNGSLYFLRRCSGRVDWRATLTTACPIKAPVTFVDDHRVLIGSHDRRIHCLHRPVG